MSARSPRREPLLIYETLVGSGAYGLDTADSDEDYRGIIIGPREWYFGFRAAPEQIELTGDHVRFELRKFLRLAQSANPNIIEMLWTEPEDRQHMTLAVR